MDATLEIAGSSHIPSSSEGLATDSLGPRSRWLGGGRLASAWRGESSCPIASRQYRRSLFLFPPLCFKLPPQSEC